MLPTSPPTPISSPATIAVTATRPPSPTPTHPTGEDDGGGAGLWLLLMLAAFIWAVAHVISVQLHPLRTCRACRGTGLHRGQVFTSAVRICRRCGGTRRELRPGARHH